MAKEFILVPDDDEKISQIVATAFQDYNGRVTLGELEKRLKNEIKFNPLIRLNEDDYLENLQLKKCRDMGYVVYELIDEIVLYR